MEKIDRREFVKGAAGLAGIVAAGYGPSLYAAGANEKIRVACVGYSDRFKGSLLPAFQASGLVPHALKKKLYIYFWLCWVIAGQALLKLWRAGATLYLWGTSFSLQWFLLLQSTGSRVPSQ